MSASREDSNWDNQPFSRIDRAIHEPARLAVVSCLYVIKRADFLFLESQTGLTRGNLSSHLAKLEKAGYVTIEKTFVDKIPHTLLSLTDRGRKAFDDYRQNMKKVIDE